jgi:hypothetical protein
MFRRFLIIGLILVGAGVVAGFIPSGECGSVFAPRDTDGDLFNSAFSTVPDCSQALDLSVVTWALIGAGAVCLLAAGVRRLTASH